MTEEEREMYDRMREHLKTEPYPLNCLSDNYVMRYLKSLQWDFDVALTYMRNAEEERRKYDCLLLREDMFIEELSWNAFNFTGCYDKVGRPILFLKWANWLPQTGTEEQILRVFTYVIDKMSVQMKANCDQYIMVYDFEGCGYSNFSISHAKLLMPYMQTVYCDR